jgi:predicted transcriptional regulator
LPTSLPPTSATTRFAPTPDLVPAVSIKKSVTPDFLICLDDGKKFTSLRRHLGKLGMTPDEYRMKWALPSDYPMVAPAYSAKRSELAKKNGLGSKAFSEKPRPVKHAAKEPGKRGRPKKAA